jgi:hypothetical protein
VPFGNVPSCEHRMLVMRHAPSRYTTMSRPCLNHGASSHTKDHGGQQTPSCMTTRIPFQAATPPLLLRATAHSDIKAGVTKLMTDAMMISGTPLMDLDQTDVVVDNLT